MQYKGIEPQYLRVGGFNPKMVLTVAACVGLLSVLRRPLVVLYRPKIQLSMKHART